MWFFVLQCFYFMLPAYLANMAPVIVKDWCKWMAVPVDFGNNIFGKNKTYRGLLFGVLFGIIVAYIQFLLYNYWGIFQSLSFVDYSNWLLLGFLFGFGALFGDMVESFVKRRIGIESGQRFVPWDQLDFVIGSLVLAGIVVDITWRKILFIAIISVIGHILVNHSAYYLGIRKEKW